MTINAALIGAIGVRATIEELDSFRRGLDSMNGWIDDFGRQAEKSGGLLQGFSNILSGVGESLQRIFEFVIARQISQVIDSIVESIKNMASAVFDAAKEFQALEIRLQGLVALELRDMSDGALSFTDALTQAVEPTKDLFFWLQKIALTSPFDVSDVADVFSMAKAYGFTADQAKELTTAVIDFTAGMGLSDGAMNKIIENFGQMIQQGKITGTELRDLARGALVPVNTLLDMTAERLGITTEELDKMRSDGVAPVLPFIESFIQLVGEDFPEAGKRASRTFDAVLGNFRDLFEGVFSFNVIKPILDQFSGALADLLDALTEGDIGERLINATASIGESLAGIAADFLGLLGPVDTFAEGLVGGIENLASKLIGVRDIVKSIIDGDTSLDTGLSAILLLFDVPEEFIEGINNVISFFDNLVEKFGIAKTMVQEFIDTLQSEGLIAALEGLGVPESILNFIGNIQTAFDNLKTFWDQNGDEVIQILADIAEAVFGVTIDAPEGQATFLEVVGALIESLSEIFVGTSGDNIMEGFRSVRDFIVDDLMPFLGTVFQFAVDNSDSIASAILLFEALGVLFDVLIKGLVIGTAIFTIGRGLGLISTFFLDVGALIASIGIVAFEAGMLSIAAMLAAVLAVFGSVSGDLSLLDFTSLAGFFESLGDFVNSISIDQLKENMEMFSDFIVDTLPEFFGIEIEGAGGGAAIGLWEGFVQKLEEIKRDVPKVLGSWVNSIVDDINNNLNTLWYSGRDTFQRLWEGFGARMNEIIGIDMSNVLYAFISMIDVKIGSFLNNVWYTGRDIFQRLWEGLGSRMNDIINFDLKDVLRAFIDRIISIVTGDFWWDLWYAGRDIFRGLWEGFGAKLNDVLNFDLDDVLQAWVDAIEDFFNMASPSKLMKDKGSLVGEGFVIGVMNALATLPTATKMAFDAFITPFSSGLGNLAPTSNVVNNQSFSMTVNSQAKTEQVASDFRLLQSLATMDT